MPAPTNLGFETVGPRAGWANSWSLRSRMSARLLASFARNEFPTLTEPNALDGFHWTPDSIAVITNTTTAPDGTMTADALRDNAVNSKHFIRRTSAIAFEAGKSYTFGFFAKKNTHNYVGAYFDLGGGNEVNSAFDVSAFNPTGRVAVAGTPAGNIDKVSSEIIDAPGVGGGGWKICATTFRMSANQSFTPGIIMISNPLGSLSYVGAVTEVWVWGVFLFEEQAAGVDDFEAGWGNSPYLLALDNPTEAIFPSGEIDPFLYEGFEKYWGNTPYLTTVVGTSALFDNDSTPETPEDFEEGWGQPFYTTIPASVDCDFGDDNDEAHENGWGNGIKKIQSVTFDIGLNQISLGRVPADGTQVQLLAAINLPSPLMAANAYYIKWVSPTVAQLALTAGGPAIDFTTAGDAPFTLSERLPDYPFDLGVDTTTDELEPGSGHPFLAGMAVVLISTGALPSPLLDDTVYFVRDVTATRFKLAATFGGGAINLTSFGGGTRNVAKVYAAFNGSFSSEIYEDFESPISDKVFTVNTGTDVFTSVAHGLANDTTVFVLSPHGGEIPEGLNPTVTYYVVNATADTFQLALTSGGSAVNVTTAGVGEQRVRANPALYWNGPDINTTI